MADNQEEVVYSYTGDVSSLRDATAQAISLLDKFDGAMKRAASSDTFKASKTSTVQFQRTLGGLIKQVNTLTTALNTSGGQIAQAMPDTVTVVQNTSKALTGALDALGKETGVSSTDLKGLTDSLKAIKAEMEAVTSRAVVLSRSLKPLEQLSRPEVFGQNGDSVTDGANADVHSEQVTAKLTRMQTLVQHLSADVSLLGAKVAQVWSPFSRYLDPVITKLQRFKSVSEGSLGKIPSMLASVSAAYRRLTDTSEGSNSALARLISGHQRLKETLSKLGIQFRRETEAVQTEEQSLDEKNRTLTRSTRGHRSLLQILTNLGRSLVSETQNLRIFNLNLRNSYTSTNLLRRALSGLTAVKLGEWLAAATKQSIKYTENLNLFKVAMGSAEAAGTNFVNTMSEMYGMDPSNLMRYAGNFYQLADAIEMPDQAAANLSLGLTKATNDIASLFNIDVETVFENLSSGMQGMSRAVRKYGMDIRTTTLQQTALSLGITEQVESMSEANRMGLRFIAMMRQASNASGDFARTIESPANQLRIFKEQMSQLGRAIGDLFIAPLATALQYINGFVMALRMIISFVGSVLGLVNSIAGSVSTSGLSDVETAVDGVGTAADTAAGKLKSMLAPFDELNVLQDKQSGGSAGVLSDIGALDPAIEQAIADMQWKLENVRMKAVEVRDALLEFFGFEIENGTILSWDSSEFESNLIAKFPQWTATIQAAFDSWAGIVAGFKSVLTALGDVAQLVWDKVSGFLTRFVNDTSVSDFVSGLSGSLQKLATFITDNQDLIANFAITIFVLSKAFAGLRVLGAVLQPILTVASSVAGAVSSISGVVGVIAAVVAVIAVLYTSSESFANAFNGLLTAVAEGVVSIVNAFLQALGTVWQGVQDLWAEHIQPMLEKIGDAMAPVIETITELWQNLVDIVVSVFQAVETVWTTILQPVLAEFFDAIGTLADVFKVMWEDVVGPIVEELGDDFERLWTTTLQPVITKVIEIVGRLIETFLIFWNNVLAPIISWLIRVFGPMVSQVFNTVLGAVTAVIQNIGGLIQGLLTILDGLLTFLGGVFSGDWSRVWQGIVQVFAGVWQSISSIFKAPLNVAIGFINTFLSAIVSALNVAVRAINNLSFTIPDWVPEVGGYTFGFKLKQLTAPSIPYLKNGGVVTSPTMAMIGEGKYDEAVIPLGNSPQMQELVDRVAQATEGASSQPIQVQVYIGNEQVAEYMHHAERKNRLQTNGGY